MSAYFNTNKETGQQLAASEKKALTQNDLILQCFQETPDATYTAWETWNIFEQWKNWPLTSCRRACTTLCNAGLIEETQEMRKGGYGKDNRVYRITKKGLNYKR